MLVEKELAREMPTKATNNQKGNYHNRDKKDTNSASGEVHPLDYYTKYTAIETIYTQALECLISKGKIDLLPIKPEIENTKKSRTGARARLPISLRVET